MFMSNQKPNQIRCKTIAVPEPARRVITRPDDPSMCEPCRRRVSIFATALIVGSTAELDPSNFRTASAFRLAGHVSASMNQEGSTISLLKFQLPRRCRLGLKAFLHQLDRDSVRPLVRCCDAVRRNNQLEVANMISQAVVRTHASVVKPTQAPLQRARR
jgi:hypothetical protein